MEMLFGLPDRDQQPHNRQQRINPSIRVRQVHGRIMAAIRGWKSKENWIPKLALVFCPQALAINLFVSRI
jgi:hypothetical protein